jgi:flavin-dependent dehydrogenase
MIYSKNLEVKYDVDVFVAGGGAAGVAAAVAAARSGKRVFLAEAKGSFGGAITTGLVPSIGPYYDGVRMIATGIGYELREKICQDIPKTDTWTPCKVEELKIALDELIEASGVEYSFFTSLCDVVTCDGRVDYVVLSSKSGIFAARAKIYIDCTGDGDLCALGD